MIKINAKPRFDVRTLALSAILTALALLLSLVESAIPLPVAVPGIKLGLANIVTVFALYTLGPVPALCILVVRCLLGAVFSGAISGLIFSISGGLLAYAVMLVLMHSKYISPIGVCVGGAGAHSIGQILAAIKVLGSSAPVAYLPVLLLVSVVTGLITGIVSWIVLGSLTGVMRFRGRVPVGVPKPYPVETPALNGHVPEEKKPQLEQRHAPEPKYAPEPELETVEDVLASVDRLLYGTPPEAEEVMAPEPEPVTVSEPAKTEPEPEDRPGQSFKETFEEIFDRISRSMRIGPKARHAAPALEAETEPGPEPGPRTEPETEPEPEIKPEPEPKPKSKPLPSAAQVSDKLKGAWGRFKERFDEWYYEDDDEPQGGDDDEYGRK